MLLYSVLNNKGTFYNKYLDQYTYNLLDETFRLPRKGFDFNIFAVSSKYIARPDLISLDAYGDTMYADVICKMNGISNPFELNEGMRIILPSPEYILDFAVQPEAEESEKGDELNNSEIVPVAKNKNSKRQPNEAILGDQRFRIDSATGIIIY